MSKPMSATARIAALEAQIAALLASQATTAPVVPTFATSTNGVLFPCKADKPCARSLKTAKRALSHDEATGHEARNASGVKIA